MRHPVLKARNLPYSVRLWASPPHVDVLNGCLNLFLPTSDRAAEQVYPQREDPGDADGAGQLGDVPRAGQLPRGLPERRTAEDGEPGPQRGLGVIRPRLMMIVLQLINDRGIRKLGQVWSFFCSSRTAVLLPEN